MGLPLRLVANACSRGKKPGGNTVETSDTQAQVLLGSRLDCLLITLGDDLVALLHVAVQHARLGAAIGSQGGIRVG